MVMGRRLRRIRSVRDPLPTDDLRRLIDRLGDVMFAISSDERWALLNRAWFELTGRPAEHDIGQPWIESVYVEDRVYTQHAFTQIINGEQSTLNLELRIVAAHDQVRSVVMVARPFYDGRGHVRGVVGTLRALAATRLDTTTARAPEHWPQFATSTHEHASPNVRDTTELITEVVRQLAEETPAIRVFCGMINPPGILQISACAGPPGLPVLTGATCDLNRIPIYLSELDIGSPVIIGDSVRDGRVHAVLQQFGLSGALLMMGLHMRDRLIGVIGMHASPPHPWTVHTIDRLRTVANYLVFCLHDIELQNAAKLAEEARFELERQLLQAQKLESLGVFAGGIAHDFNNLLAGILGNANLAQIEMAADSTAIEHIHQIEMLSQRAADLIRQLLAYAGHGRFVFEPLDLNSLLSDLRNILRTPLGPHIQLQLQLDPHLPVIYGDLPHVRQMLRSLVNNATEAIGDHAGTLTITTGVRHLTTADIAAIHYTPDVKEGNYLFLQVEDTGSGIQPTLQARIFEPFFSTKFTGRGLGLAAVLGVVRGHNGGIQVQSTLGSGSSFTIFLPIDKPPSLLLPTQPPLSKVETGAHETILVVDDEEYVRMVLRRIIERLGLRVILANDGREGVELAADPEVMGVLLDLTMPRMGGQAAYQEIHRMRPDLPVIMMSGYDASEVAERFGDHGPIYFLQKPFTNEQVQKMVAHMRNKA